jgi:hypothetical protein
MSRIPNLAPSSLPRQERRRFNREIHKLLHNDTCSVCGRTLKHNTQTASGLDAHGNVAVAGECCTDRLTEIWGIGHYVSHHYDFLLPWNQSNIQPTNEQILDAIAIRQRVVTDTDKRLDGIERRGGAGRPRNVSMLDTPWKDDDRAWFERNPSRAHRVRMLFPGEADKEATKAPAGHTLIVMLRQVEPGTRLKAGFYFNTELLPLLPDDEAVAHALFEVAVRHETVPRNPQAFSALVDKYAAGATCA